MGLGHLLDEGPEEGQRLFPIRIAEVPRVPRVPSALSILNLWVKCYRLTSIPLFELQKQDGRGTRVPRVKGKDKRPGELPVLSVFSVNPKSEIRNPKSVNPKSEKCAPAS